MKLLINQIDAFADKPFEGNPAVVNKASEVVCETTIAPGGPCPYVGYGLSVVAEYGR